jgi:hypothetical protein
MKNDAKLQKGDRVWYLRSPLYDVEITDVQSYLDGKPLSFRCSLFQGIATVAVVDGIHRSSLFKLPEERDVLILKLREHARVLEDYATRLEDGGP